MKMDGRQLRKDLSNMLYDRGWDWQVDYTVRTVYNRYDEPELEVYFTKVNDDQIKVIGEYVDWWFRYYRRNLKASKYSVIQGAFTL